MPFAYSGFDNRPLYNSVDASLLLFEQVKKYIEYTKDYEFIKENIYEKLEKGESDLKGKQKEKLEKPIYDLKYLDIIDNINKYYEELNNLSV